MEIKDYEARTQALDPYQSFIVQAPAGSGKTELLIQRYLALLDIVQKPEEILAITFTKKSAHEMRLRVINALKNAQSAPEPETKHAKKTWQLAKAALSKDQKHHWQIIDNPNQLHIQTIDSFCAYLTKQLPLLSQFGSPPQIATDPTDLYRDAITEVLSHLEGDYSWTPAIAYLLLHLDNDLNKLHNLLVDLLAKRDQWLPYVHLDMADEDIRHELEQYLVCVIEEKLIFLEKIFPKKIMADLMKVARMAADYLKQKKSNSEIVYCRDQSNLPTASVSDLPVWLGLAKLLLTKQCSWRKKWDAKTGLPTQGSIKNITAKAEMTAARSTLATIVAACAENAELSITLGQLFTLPEPVYSQEQWEILQNLFQVLKVITAQLRVIFQQAGQIDFIENTQAALLALGDELAPTDLALALDYQIRHILVDEFQDTSINQYQLLEKLTLGWESNDGRTLFVVGDPMQSIYRFRKAEVGLFLRMIENGIGTIRLKSLNLTVNFRSHKEIVDWNNLYFSQIFPKKNHLAHGAVIYNPSLAFNEDALNAKISVHGFLTAEDQYQAQTIVKIIQERCTQVPLQHIALLVRSRSHLLTILPALKKAEIPYQAIDIDPLSTKQAILDLYALTCALLHPADRIAWLAILRAPWCGLKLEDLAIIAEDARSIIWLAMQEVTTFERLSLDAQSRLAKIIPILKAALASRDRVNFRFWIENTWVLLGGPATLNASSDLHDTQAYFTLLEEFSNSSLLLNLDNLKEKLNLLYAKPSTAANAVQIMTIHSAKGLEFDTVILPHLECKLPQDDKSLLSWLEQPLLDDRIALLLAPINAVGTARNQLYDFISQEQRYKANYETDRLLYVATTRAKNSLHLLFNTEKHNDQYKIETGSFLEKLMPVFIKQKSIIWTMSDENKTESNITETETRPIKRLVNDWQNIFSTTTPATVFYHQQANGFKLDDHLPRIVGTIIHTILQQLSLESIEFWRKRTQIQQQHYVQQLLLQMGLKGKLIPQGIKMVLKAVENTLNDERGIWILKSHQEARSEYALTAVVAGQVQRVVIDRTFVDEENVRWIIDYKTSTLSQKDLDLFLQNEQLKYQEKMKLYFQALNAIVPYPTRLGLYFPAIPSWLEWSP